MDLTRIYRGGFLESAKAPCLSLYQPTHRHFPEKRQDSIRFRNLVKTLEASLEQKYPPRDIRPLLDPFYALVEDQDFWNYGRDGLAILAAPGIFNVCKLQRPVPELAIVAESFHTKPLLRIAQSADRYQILGLSRSEIRLFEGNRDALDEIELAPDVPRTITDALGDELTEPRLTVSTNYGKGAGGPAMHHGHGGRKDQIPLDTERFFRAIDQAILEHHSRPSGLPLLLAALPEHHPDFHKISHNPFLLPDGIDVHPDNLDIDEFRERAWKAVEPHYLSRLADLVDKFSLEKSRGLGTEDLAEAARAALNGRVATVLIEAERQVPGRITESGEIEFDDIQSPEVGDLLDELGETVLRMGGDVVVVPAERMPTNTGIAATYRY